MTADLPVSVGAVIRATGEKLDAQYRRLEQLKRHGAAAEQHVFEQVCGGKSLGEVAKDLALPPGAFVTWFLDEHGSVYEAALKVRADELAHGALFEADKAEDRDSAAAAKVKADTRLKLASKWDRKRYGDDERGTPMSPVTIQIANLRGAELKIEAPALPLEQEPA